MTQTCPSCGKQVTPTDVGRCPKCREMLTASNPYAPARQVAQSPMPIASDGKAFSQQAAKFSILAPLVILVLGCFLGTQRGENARLIGLVIGLVNVLIMTLGVIFGVVGFAGGIRNRWWGTLTMALVGLVANGFLVLVVFAGFQAARIKEQKEQMEQERGTEQRAPLQP
jgi:hypothetical protein